MAFDDEMLDEANKRLLVKKIWCHGQAVAPFQGLLCGYWAIIDPAMPLSQRAMLWSAALVLPLWSYVSWKAMHGHTLDFWKLICYFGIGIEVLHISVMTVAAQHLKEPLNMLTFVFSGLHVVETAGYLLITTYFRQTFANDTGRQLSLLWNEED